MMADNGTNGVQERDPGISLALEEIAAEEARLRFARLAAAAGAKTILDDFERRRKPK